jgi:hypothetical protein
MTHEPIHTVHLTPHITWQGTQAELEAMQKLAANQRRRDHSSLTPKQRRML